MARGEVSIETAEIPRWGVFSFSVVPEEETRELEGINKGVVELEVIGQWYHRRYLVATQRRPIRLLIKREQLSRLIRELEEREDW